MSSMPNELLIAFLLLLAAILAVILFMRYKRSNTERRMMSMLERQGLDPEIAREGDTKAIVDAVRQRCSRCQSEAVCERWLAGETGGENDFCPNAEVFKALGAKADPV